MNCEGSCIVYRHNDTCILNDFAIDSPESISALVSIQKVDDDYYLRSTEVLQSNSLWIAIKYLSNSSYELREGNVLKLGRATIRVKKISSKIELLTGWNEIPETPGEKLCKICCSDENSNQDPLVSLCKCAGSMKYIHFMCLKNWLKCKVTFRSFGRVASYSWNEFKCELCNSALPEHFQYKGQSLTLLDITYPDSAYILLEEIKTESSENQVLYVVGLNESESVSIGRGNDSEIKLSDISVSREHARVKFLNNKFFIQDNRSKFGTLISVCKELLLTQGNEVTIQVNRTIIHFLVKRPFVCCKKSRVVPLMIN